MDSCDDCAVGLDGIGSQSDFRPLADGPDLDTDGLCDLGYPDIDGDGVNNEFDNCPLISNTDQIGINNNHLGDVCESAFDFCIPFRSRNSNIAVDCL